MEEPKIGIKVFGGVIALYYIAFLMTIFPMENPILKMSHQFPFNLTGCLLVMALAIVFGIISAIVIPYISMGIAHIYYLLHRKEIDQKNAEYEAKREAENAKKRAYWRSLRALEKSSIPDIDVKPTKEVQ